MEAKWFFVVWISIILVLALVAVYFIAAGISTQLYNQFQTNLNISSDRFANSSIVHQFILDNNSEILQRLDPVLDEVSNATQMRLDQEQHYNQTDRVMNVTYGLEKILSGYSNSTERIDREVQDHQLLLSINNSLSSLIGGGNNGNNNNDTIIINNGTPVPLGNITNTTTVK